MSASAEEKGSRALSNIVDAFPNDYNNNNNNNFIQYYHFVQVIPIKIKIINR